jgi:hypothetical protein
MKTLKNENLIHVILLLIGMVLSVFSVYFTQAEDMGIFLSVSSMLTKGYKLYTDIFDNKDPIFYYSAAGMMNIFGLRGAFLIDFILIAISPICSYKALKNLEFRIVTSFVSSVLFTLALTGGFYQPFRTQILGIVLLIVSLALIGKNNFVVGVLLSIVFFTKLNLIVFFPVFIALIFKKNFKFIKNSIEVLLGFLFFSSLMIVIMIARGEFSGYVGMVQTNFRYAESYQKIVGLPEGIIGHLNLWNSNYGSLIYYITALALIAIFLQINSINLLNRNQRVLLITVNISTFIFLGLTNLWAHHLQILAFSTLINFAAIFEIMIKSELFKDNEKIFSIKTQYKSSIRALTWILATLCIIEYSGLTLPVKPKMNLERWVNPNWTLPPEIIELNSKIGSQKTGVNVARLGMNDDLAFGAFLDSKKFTYKCTRLYILGFETKLEAEEFLSCISKHVDVLTVGPMFAGIDRPHGNYTWYKAKANEMLVRDFTCSPLETTTYRICLKKSN